MRPFNTLTTTLAMVILGAILAPMASAQCGYFDGSKAPASIWQHPWQPQARLRPASFVLISNDGDDDSDKMSIVGFWKVEFVAEGNAGGPPDGTVIDAGLAQWHGDGTEIMNSGRKPPSSSFCLGVWKKVGGSTYTLNHFALSWNDTGTTFIGPANIREDVTVNHGGDTFTGTFTIDQFGPNNQLVPGGHVEGTISGIRIMVDTSVGDIF